MVNRKKQPIDELRESDSVDDVFCVKMKKGLKKYAKGYCFQLLLTDSSGHSIDYRYWGGQDEDKVKSLYDSIKADCVVHVQGKVASFNNKLQISTNEPNTITALQEGEYVAEDFIGPARKDVSELTHELMQLIQSVEDLDYSKLLEHIFSDQKRVQKFITHPGAIEIHHNWTGGLLEHTLEVAKICKVAAVDHEQIDLDLLISSAILHDIGKLDELTVTSRIKGTREGQLIGHITMGYDMVKGFMNEVETPKDKAVKLLHSIISHHGRLDFGSPKPPMTVEAMILYYSDELSSKAGEVSEFVKWAKGATEDEFMYNRRHERNIYLK